MGMEIISLPTELLERIFGNLDAVDLARLGCCCKELLRDTQSDAVWKQQLARKFQHRRNVNTDCFLGQGWFRKFREESFLKSVARIGKSSSHSSQGTLERLLFTSSQETEYAMLLTDGLIEVVSLEGKTMWTMDCKKNGNILIEEEERRQRRLELGAPHKNQLFTFKISQSNDDTERFSLWSDNEENSKGDEVEEQAVVERGRLIRSFSSESESGSVFSTSVESHSSGSSTRVLSSSASSESSVDDCVEKTRRRRGKKDVTRPRTIRKKQSTKKRSHGPLDRRSCFFADAKTGCAVVQLGTGEWHMLQFFKHGCQQNHLNPPRWVRNRQSDVTCAAFIPALETHPFKFGGRTFFSSGADTPVASTQQSTRKVVAATGHESGSIMLWGESCEFLNVIHTSSSDSITHLILDKDTTLTSADSAGVITRWEPNSSRKLATMRLEGRVEQLVVQHEAGLVIAGSEHGMVYVYKLHGKLLTSYRAHDGAVTVLRCRQLQEVVVISSGGQDGKILAKRIRSTGNRLHAKSLSSTCSSDCEPSKDTRQLIGHVGAVRDIYLDDHKLVSCGDDGSIKFWSLGEEEEIKALRTIKSKSNPNRRPVPVVQLLVGSLFVLGCRQDGSVLSFTFLPSWNIANNAVASRPRLPQDDTSLLHQQCLKQQTPTKMQQVMSSKRVSSTPAKKRLNAGSSSRHKSRSKPIVRDEDIMELLFEDAFDAFDLQEMHDFHND